MKISNLSIPILALAASMLSGCATHEWTLSAQSSAEAAPVPGLRAQVATAPTRALALQPTVDLTLGPDVIQLNTGAQLRWEPTLPAEMPPMTLIAGFDVLGGGCQPGACFMSTGGGHGEVALGITETTRGIWRAALRVDHDVRFGPTSATYVGIGAKWTPAR